MMLRWQEILASLLCPVINTADLGTLCILINGQPFYDKVFLRLLKVTNRFTEDGSSTVHRWLWFFFCLFVFSKMAAHFKEVFNFPEPSFHSLSISV